MADVTAPHTGTPEKLVLQPDPSAVRQGQWFVRTACKDLGVAPNTCNTAVLLASELIRNAFIRGRSEARIQLGRTQRHIRVSVADDNSLHPERVAEDLDGRGLTILELLADDWGAQDDPFGETVWFTLPA